MGRDYTYSELMAMQEEATQRVREMQRRAQIAAQRAQEELDQKKDAAPPSKESAPVPLSQDEGGTKKNLSPKHQPADLPIADADRLAFLDSGPKHTPPSAGKPHQQKHISMPIDFIQEKREEPHAGGELLDHAGNVLPRSGQQGVGAGLSEKSPLNLLEGGSDQSLLLALMLLLNGEGTDELLLLALLYMMM